MGLAIQSDSAVSVAAERGAEFFLNVLPDAEWELDAEGSPAPDEDEWWDDWPQFAARDLICERLTAVRAASRLPSDCSRRDT